MTWRVFYSYSPQDADLRDRLGTHLAPLVRQGKISAWDERKIMPGTDWESAVSERLNSAHLVLLLLSADYLASDYCFGAEIERALARLKRGEVRMMPLLLRPCLWQESLFSELQVLPRNGVPVTCSASIDGALNEVAASIREIVSEPPPRSKSATRADFGLHGTDPALALVARQMHSYARLYERTRQRMAGRSVARTARMEQIFERMRTLAPVSSPLLHDLANSPSPGERLAAVAILQSFAVEEYLPFLLQLVESGKAFIGYHALLALRVAVDGLEPPAYPELSRLLQDAESALDKRDTPPDSDRRAALSDAQKALRVTQEIFSDMHVEPAHDPEAR